MSSDLSTQHIRPGSVKASKKLVDSIRMHGILVPIIVSETPADVFPYRIVDGARRFDAAVRLGLSLVPCFVMEGTIIDQEKATITINEVRSYNPVGEFYAVRSLRQQGLDDSEICKQTGLPMNRLKKLERISKLPLSIVSQFEKGKLSLTMAGRIATMTKEKQDEVAKIVHKNRDKPVAFTPEDMTEVRKVDVAIRLPDINLEVHDRVNGVRAQISSLPIEKQKVDALLSAFDAILKNGG